MATCGQVRDGRSGPVAGKATFGCNRLVGCVADSCPQLRHGFAIMGLASADFTAPECHAQNEGLVALVLWRLRDPAWRPSFRDLMEDARTCIDPATDAATVLGALRGALATDATLAERATALAIEARDIMVARPASPRRGAAPVRAPDNSGWQGFAPMFLGT
jgi:hypothetical protein